MCSAAVAGAVVAAVPIQQDSRTADVILEQALSGWEEEVLADTGAATK